MQEHELEISNPADTHMEMRQQIRVKQSDKVNTPWRDSKLTVSLT